MEYSIILDQYDNDVWIRNKGRYTWDERDGMKIVEHIIQETPGVRIFYWDERDNANEVLYKEFMMRITYLMENKNVH